MRRPWWRGWPMAVLAGGVAVLVAMGVTVAVLTGGGDPPPPAPTLAHDPVPRPLNVLSEPSDCGVPATAVRKVLRTKRYAPPNGDCWWRADAPPNLRELEADFALSQGTDPGGGSPAADAMGVFPGAIGTARAKYADVPGQTVTGLGDEAVAGYQQKRGNGVAWVVFRAGNAVVTVMFGGGTVLGLGTRGVRGRPVPRTEAVRGALTVASAVAKGLGAPASHPRVTAVPAAPAPITRAFDACTIVPKDVLDRFLRDGIVGPARMPMPNVDSLLDSPASSGCVWSAEHRKLVVRIESARSRTATAEAAREFLRRYYVGRTNGTFDPLRGLGDQAFGTYADDMSSDVAFGDLGEVAFRTRNVIVSIGYGTSLSEPEPLPDARAIDGAYAIAARVAGAVHG